MLTRVCYAKVCYTKVCYAKVWFHGILRCKILSIQCLIDLIVAMGIPNTKYLNANSLDYRKFEISFYHISFLPKISLEYF